MSSHSTRPVRVMGSGLAAAVLLAVPAFALCYADMDVFSPSAPVSAVAPAAADESVILSNWQFTSDGDHDRDDRRSTHPTPARRFIPPGGLNRPTRSRTLTTNPGTPAVDRR